MGGGPSRDRKVRLQKGMREDGRGNLTFSLGLDVKGSVNPAFSFQMAGERW